MYDLRDESTQDLFDLLDEEVGSQSVREEHLPIESIEGTKSTILDLSAAISPMDDGSDETVIKRLAALSTLEYDRVRKTEAEALKIRPGTLDKLVIADRKGNNNTSLQIESVEPWDEPVDPAQLLTYISVCVRRFIVCEPDTANTVALWAAMTHFIDVVQVAPLAVITAPEKRCGKSQLLFLLGRLVNRPLTASNISPAALFRAIDAWQPTLLVDEADAFMRENEELRGLINCGHTRDSAYIVRVVGENFTPTKFNVWGAKAICGIGHLADTLMDRAVILELRRKLPHESVDRLRHAEPDLFDMLAAKLARFAYDYRCQVRVSRPHLPEQLNDRAQDNWEPLLAIADTAGGQWPQLARSAALKLSGSESDAMSVGVELLADIQEIFDSLKTDKVFTAKLIEALCEDEEKPWATYNRGKSIAPRQVSNKLKGYGIESKTIRIGHDTKKGFTKDQFQESFNRYLHDSKNTLPESPFSSVTTSQSTADVTCSVADVKHVTGTEELKRNNNTNTDTADVTDKTTRYSIEKLSVTPQPTIPVGCDAVTDKTPLTAETFLNDDVEIF